MRLEALLVLALIAPEAIAAAKKIESGERRICVPSEDGRSWECGTPDAPPPERGLPANRSSAPSPAPPPFLMDPRRAEAMELGLPLEEAPAEAPVEAPAVADEAPIEPAAEEQPPAPEAPALADELPAEPAAPEPDAVVPEQVPGDQVVAEPVAEPAFAEPAFADPAVGSASEPDVSVADEPTTVEESVPSASEALAEPAPTEAEMAETPAESSEPPALISAPGEPQTVPLAPRADDPAPVAPEAAPEPVAEPAEPVVASEDPPLPQPVETQPAAQPEAAPAAPEPAATAPAAASAPLDARAFLALGATRHTVQLARASSPSQFGALLASLGIEAESAYAVPLAGDGVTWWLLLWGDFPDAASAREAVAAIPRSAALASAWPRRIAPLQDELRSAGYSAR